MIFPNPVSPGSREPLRLMSLNVIPLILPGEILFRIFILVAFSPGNRVTGGIDSGIKLA